MDVLGRDLQEWPCVLGHLGWCWQGAPPALAAGWALPVAVPLSPALLEAGRKEGAAGRTSSTKGCQALQSCPDLSVRAWIIDLKPAAWLGACCWLFWVRRVILARLHAVIRH